MQIKQQNLNVYFGNSAILNDLENIFNENSIFNVCTKVINFFYCGVTQGSQLGTTHISSSSPPLVIK